MANITIPALRPVGYDLFSSSESFITELGEEELSVKGGITPGIVLGAAGMYIYYEYIK